MLQVKKMNFIKISILVTLLSILGISCNETTSSEITDSSNFYLTYVKAINNNWEIVLNHNGEVINVSNNSLEDNDPDISPDKKKIAFTYFTKYGNTCVYLYYLESETLIGINPTTEFSARSPQWIDNDRMIYDYHKIGENSKTYIMNKDGSNSREILNCTAKIYFYNNLRDFIYKPVGADDYKIIYQTDIFASYKKIILDLNEIGKEYTGIYGFNPNEEKLLLLIAQTPRYTNIVAEYDLKNKTLDTIAIAEDGYVYLKPQYSNDYSKIALVCKNYDLNILKLLLINEKKITTLEEIQEPTASFGFYYKAFSPDDKQLVYMKYIFNSGNTWWDSYVYIKNLVTNQNFFIDKANDPIWINN